MWQIKRGRPKVADSQKCGRQKVAAKKRQTKRDRQKETGKK